MVLEFHEGPASRLGFNGISDGKELSEIFVGEQTVGVRNRFATGSWLWFSADPVWKRQTLLSRCLMEESSNFSWETMVKPRETIIFNLTKAFFPGTRSETLHFSMAYGQPTHFFGHLLLGTGRLLPQAIQGGLERKFWVNDGSMMGKWWA